MENRDFQTAEIIQKFALLMRRSMEWDKDTVTLREEVELVKSISADSAVPLFGPDLL